MPHPGDDPRVYGMPDPSNRQPPGEEGMRGEEGAQREADPEFAHTEILPDGRKVVIEEDSGVAYAEATGKTDERASGKDAGET
jgi:hypothetical protein